MKGKKSASKKSVGKKPSRVPSTGKQAVTALKKRIIERANLRRELMLGGLGLLALAAVAGIFIFAFPRKPVIAFYDIPEPVRSALVAQAADPAHPGKYAFRFRDLDPSQPLAAQLRTRPRPALVFCLDGQAARDIATQTIAPPDSVRRLMPSAMRSAGLYLDEKSVERAYGLPLLLDHFELAYSREQLSRAGKPKPETLQEIEATAKAVKKPAVWPLVCAGAQDADLLMLVGSLTEALGGEEAWNRVVNSMREGTPFAELVSKTPLGETLRMLVDWRERGLLHPEWFRMKDADIVAFMENDNAAMVLMPLSAHRTIPLKTIEKYESTFFPSTDKTGIRSFTVPAYIGIELYSKRPDKKADVRGNGE